MYVWRDKTLNKASSIDNISDTIERPRVVIRRKTNLGRQQVDQVIGVMPAKALVDNHYVPHFDHITKKGFQRPPQQARVNKLVHDLERNRVDVPTAVLLNIRDCERSADEAEVLVAVDDNTYFAPDGRKLYVVDGQHRVLALKKLLEKYPEKWASFPVPFVCMLGASEEEEMTEFYVVNSNAKSVRVDLAYELLSKRSEMDPTLMNDLVEKGENWKVDAQMLTEQLEKDSPFWKGKIRFPGQAVAETTVGSAGVVGSLKPLLATPYFGTVLLPPHRGKILNAYWEGIRRVLPNCFEEPRDYALQKAIGIQVMHQLLIPVIEVLRTSGHSVLEAEAYELVLKDALQTLEADNGEGIPVRGEDFWRVGREGAAGAFSNNAGRRVLTAKLTSQLPSVGVEVQ